MLHISAKPDVGSDGVRDEPQVMERGGLCVPCAEFTVFIWTGAVLNACDITFTLTGCAPVIRP